jgi:hypothetical protein
VARLDAQLFHRGAEQVRLRGAAQRFAYLSRIMSRTRRTRRAMMEPTKIQERRSIVELSQGTSLERSKHP